MTKLTPVDYKLLLELMKGAKRSDTELAKLLDISQPTVTRRRSIIERELIDGYTAIPKWEKLGYAILAIIFHKTKPILGLEDRYEEIYEKGKKWLMEQPNILMGGGCRGMGMDSFIISVHKSYSDFNNFMYDHKRKFGDLIEDVQAVLVDLGGREVLKPLHLKYFAEAEVSTFDNAKT